MPLSENQSFILLLLLPFVFCLCKLLLDLPAATTVAVAVTVVSVIGMRGDLSMLGRKKLCRFAFSLLRRLFTLTASASPPVLLLR